MDMRQNIQQLTDQFVSKLVDIVTDQVQFQVAEALQGVLGRATGTAGKNGVAPKIVTRPKGGVRLIQGKRSPEQIAKTKAQLLKYITSHEGKRAEEIEKATGISTSDLALPIKALIAEKAIRHEGVARGRKYFARA